MVSRLSILITISFAVFALIDAASIQDNRIFETPRINNGDQLIMAVANDCFDGNTFTCLKGKVLTYLDSIIGLQEEEGRSFDNKNIDNVIYNRVSRILQSNDFRVQLPETIFQNAIVSYNAVNGLDFDLPEQKQGEGMLIIIF